MPVRAGSLRLPQPDTVAHFLQHAAGARGIEARPSARQHFVLAEQIDPELQRILAGSMRQLVDEGLEHEGQRIVAGRPQRPGRHAERHQRRP